MKAVSVQINSVARAIVYVIFFLFKFVNKFCHIEFDFIVVNY
jgi:hypothetical protein